MLSGELFVQSRVQSCVNLELPAASNLHWVFFLQYMQFKYLGLGILAFGCTTPDKELLASNEKVIS